MSKPEWITKCTGILPRDLYFQIGLGWAKILETLCTELQLQKDIDPRLRDYYATQVKEKFGKLVFHTNTVGTGDTQRLITEAEKTCARTCEYCGMPGKERNDPKGWVKILCNTCILWRTYSI